MADLSPVGDSHAVSIHPAGPATEGNGHVAWCTCGWTAPRWNRVDAERAKHLHLEAVTGRRLHPVGGGAA